LPLIPVLRRQPGLQSEFQDSQGYLRPCFEEGGVGGGGGRGGGGGGEREREEEEEEEGGKEERRKRREEKMGRQGRKRKANKFIVGAQVVKTMWLEEKGGFKETKNLFTTYHCQEMYGCSGLLPSVHQSPSFNLYLQCYPLREPHLHLYE